MELLHPEGGLWGGNVESFKEVRSFWSTTRCLLW